MAGGDLLVYHADALGSVRALTDGYGELVGAYRTDEFGQVLTSSPDNAQPFGYAGEQFDAETGFVYLRARMYDPATGRFLSRDPFPGFATSPASQNPYSYAHNNPVNYTDPSGRVVFAPMLAAAGVGAVVGAFGGAMVGIASGQGAQGVLTSAMVGAASGTVAAVAPAGWGAGLLVGIATEIARELAIGQDLDVGAIAGAGVGGALGGAYGGWLAAQAVPKVVTPAQAAAHSFIANFYGIRPGLTVGAIVGEAIP
jgi:RHS repeat-associated protein